LNTSGHWRRDGNGLVEMRGHGKEIGEEVEKMERTGFFWRG
jgi:hypothetical protein